MITALSVLAAVTAGAGTAEASWQSGGSGTTSIVNGSLPAGATPTVSRSGRNVTVAWTASTMGSATVSYLIRRYDSSTGVQQIIGSACAGTITGVTCTETGLPAGTWRFSTTPTYATWTGPEGTKSLAVTTPPPAPTGVSASATSSSSIDLGWSAAPGADGYQVLRATSSGGPYTLIASPAGISYTDTGLAASSAYFYVIAATFNGVASATSSQVNATTGAATLVNGGFEAGSLVPWTSTPAPASSQTTSAQTAFDGFTAHGGSYFAVVFPGAVGAYAHLSTSFSASAGQTISGWAYFDGGDYMPYDDDGAVVIQQGGSDLTTVFAASISALGSYGKTGWTYWSYTVPASGTYTVDARVRNSVDGTNDSSVGLDDVVVQ